MSDNTSKSNPKNKEKKTAEPSTKRMRQSSSTSTEDTAMIIDKSELEDIIQNSIAVAMEKYQVEVKQMIEKNHSELINKIELLEHENQTLKAQKEILLTKMDVLNAENKETLTTLNNLKQEMEYLQTKTNDNEQYSRKNHIRIFGLPENTPNTENSKQLVRDFIKDRLKIPLTLPDIDGAHRVGIARNGKPRGMIVRFLKRADRMEVLRARKVLKGTGISVAEDLTKLNVQLLNRAKNHPKIEQSYSWNNKCWAVGKNGTRIKLTLHCNIDSLLDAPRVYTPRS